MKNRVKLFLATALVLVLTFALTACSSPVVGKWQITKIKSGSISLDVEELAELTGQEISLVIDIKADGTCTMSTTLGDSATAQGTWTFEDDQLTIDSEKSDTDVVFDYDSNKDVLTIEIVIFM